MYLSDRSHEKNLLYFFYFYQVLHFLDHTANCRRIIVYDDIVRTPKPKSFDRPLLVLERSSHTLLLSNLDLFHLYYAS